MRYKSTELMGTIKAFVEEYYKNYRHSPSTTEIADAVGIARGTAYKYLVAMNENGMIRYDGQQISTEQTEKVQTEFTSVALLGAVSCGVPTLEEEYIEEYVSLPASMFGKGTFFLLRAKGESMIEAGISPGDLVLVRKQSEAYSELEQAPSMMEVCGLPYSQMKVLDMGFWQIDFDKDLNKGLSKAH